MSLGSGWRLPRTVSCGPEGRALQPGSGGGSARLEPEAAWRSPAGAGPAHAAALPTPRAPVLASPGTALGTRRESADRGMGLTVAF